MAITTSRRRDRQRRGLLGVLVCFMGVVYGHANAQDSLLDRCAGELTRPLGLMQLAGSIESRLQAVCPSGTVERVTLNAAVGASSTVTLDFQQSAFDDAIYHVDIRDSALQPLDWIDVAPPAGKISNTATISLGLTINPPAELIASMQTVILEFTIHDGTQSWSRKFELQISVGEEQSLFRDRFEIEPVIGQFSQRAPARRAARFGAAASAPGD